MGGTELKRFLRCAARWCADARAAREAIAAHSLAHPGLMTAGAYLANLERLAADPALSYRRLDCSGYAKKARGGLGYHGATTNFARHCACAGRIADLGGDGGLIPGMELYQGEAAPGQPGRYFMRHMGVYAGLRDLGDGVPRPAVYQSSPAYTRLARKYGKKNGPNLTAMTGAWNWWGWSKYVRTEEMTP